MNTHSSEMGEIYRVFFVSFMSNLSFTPVNAVSFYQYLFGGEGNDMTDPVPAMRPTKDMAKTDHMCYHTPCTCYLGYFVGTFDYEGHWPNAIEYIYQN